MSEPIRILRAIARLARTIPDRVAGGTSRRVGSAVELRVAFVVVLALPALAASAATGARSGCPATEGAAYVVSLASVTKPSSAGSLRTEARRVGFKEAVVSESVPSRYDVVIYGISSPAAGKGTVAEARKAGFTTAHLTANRGDCRDRDSDWEIVVGHTTTKARALALLARAKRAGHSAIAIERESANNFEVSQGGLGSTDSFVPLERVFARQGFPVVGFEPS